MKLLTLIVVAALSLEAKADPYSDLRNTNKRIDALKVEMAPYEASLQAEKDKSNKIKRLLLGGLSQGCWKDRIIQDIEISLKGNHKVNSTKNEKMIWGESKGTSEKVGLDFGNGITYLNENENTASLITDNGVSRFIVPEGNFKIGQISQIKIEKFGTNVSNNYFCTGIVFKDCLFEIKEADVYEINEAKIQINGQVLYEAKNLKKSLKSISLTVDLDLTNNPAYVDLMSRSDCPLQ